MKTDAQITVAFTGRRTYTGERDEQLRLAVERLYGQGYRVFLTGMASGFDLAAGEAVVQLKNSLPQLQLWCIVPYEGHRESLPRAEHKLYDLLLQAAENVVTLAARYDKTVFLRRNDFLVEQASMIVAYYDGGSGGTAYTLRRAVAKGCRIENLWLNPQQELKFE